MKHAGEQTEEHDFLILKCTLRTHKNFTRDYRFLHITINVEESLEIDWFITLIICGFVTTGVEMRTPNSDKRIFQMRSFQF